MGGGFTALGNETTGMTSRNRIGRLNSDGTVDLTFDPGANGEVLRIGDTAEWTDPGRRGLRPSRRWRERHDHTQPNRAAQPRRVD